MAVTNSDDHLRNHDFLLTNTGWKLSDLYHVNPAPYTEALSLNVSMDDNNIDLALAIKRLYFMIFRKTMPKNTPKKFFLP
jgi:serine/threonine-protein kinase HipA